MIDWRRRREPERQERRHPRRRRRRSAWRGLAALVLAVLAGAGGTAGAGAKPLNPNAPKKPPAQGTPKPGGPAAPRQARRVVLVSLDGAGAEELQQLWRDDLLDEGGFARFFREGEVASALVPVDPTITAPNHVSLATGAAPDHTGIVGNHFHPADSPPFTEAGGFTFPIGVETLWEAARRQKKRVAVMTWPGVDGSEPRRRADLGMTWVAGAEREPRLLVLGRSDWRPAATPPPKLASRLPVLALHITLGRSEPAGGGAAAGAPPSGGGGTSSGAGGGASSGGAVPPAGFDLYVVASGGGGQEGYDGVVVAAGAPAGKAPSVANLEQSEPLAPGQWAEIAFPDRGGRSIAWVKVLALDPDLDTARIYFSGTYPLPAYPPDLAKDLAESNLAWPGPPDDRRLTAAWNGEAGIDLDTWTEQAERFAAFFGGAMRVAAARDDWDLMLGYMPVIDEAGHQLMLTDPHQAGYSAARRDELARARRRVWQAVDHELRLLMAAVDLGRTTVVVVSDHGMAPVHTSIDLNALLRDRGLLASPPGRNGDGGGGRTGAAGAPAPGAPGPAAPSGSSGLAAYVIGNGGMAHLYLAGPGGGAVGADAAVRRRQLLELRDQLLAWRSGDDTPIERAVTRQEAAELGLDHPNSGDLILFAHEGYAFDPGPGPAGTPTTHPAAAYGMHGYLSSHPDMRGIYLAIGKDVKPASSSGTVQATDVAGRVAAWLGMGKPMARAPAGAAAGRGSGH